MGNIAKTLFDLCRSLAILFLMLFLGELITAFIPIGVPASIWGLLLLFSCLVLGIIKVHWIEFSAKLLIRYMVVLFIPVSVGIINYADLLVSEAKALLIPNIVSTSVTLVMIGFLSDYVFSRSSFKHLRKKVLKKRAKNNA